MENFKNKFLDIIAWILIKGPSYFWVAFSVLYILFLLGALIFNLVTNPMVTLIHMGVVIGLVIVIGTLVYVYSKFGIWKDKIYFWANSRLKEKNDTDEKTNKT